MDTGPERICHRSAIVKDEASQFAYGRNLCDAFFVIIAAYGLVGLGEWAIWILG